MNKTSLKFIRKQIGGTIPGERFCIAPYELLNNSWSYLLYNPLYISIHISLTGSMEKELRKIYFLI